ncbi:MAG: hypothetical protein AAGD04_02885 [Pseudomonadota bacterium]
MKLLKASVFAFAWLALPVAADSAFFKQMKPPFRIATISELPEFWSTLRALNGIDFDERYIVSSTSNWGSFATADVAVIFLRSDEKQWFLSQGLLDFLDEQDETGSPVIRLGVTLDGERKLMLSTTFLDRFNNPPALAACETAILIQSDLFAETVDQNEAYNDLCVPRS